MAFKHECGVHYASINSAQNHEIKQACRYSMIIFSLAMAHLLLANFQSNMARVAGHTSQASHLPCLCAAGSRTPTAFPASCKFRKNFSKQSMQAKREGFTWRSYSWRQATARPESLQTGCGAPSACTNCLGNSASCATLLAAHLASKLHPTFL